jgi:GT2 family glycosyltransferase
MSRPAIPVLGTAIVNEPYWLHRLFMSIDYPVDNFVVFNNNGRGEITAQVESIKQLVNPYVKNVHITHMPANVGCGGAWNLIIKCFMNAPYWIISNHDVMFTPGFLAEMVEHAADEQIGIVFGAKRPNDDHGRWDIFLLKDSTVQKCGLFDENLYPAYCEDSDYNVRLKKFNIGRVDALTRPYYHGRSSDHDFAGDGSATKKHAPELSAKIDYAYKLNVLYMNKKWGENWQNFVDDQTYNTPFNSPLPISFTTYQLDFNRRKNLGF